MCSRTIYRYVNISICCMRNQSWAATYLYFAVECDVRMYARINIAWHHLGAKFQSSWNCGVNYNSTGHSYHKLNITYVLHKSTCHYYCKLWGNIWKFSDASNDRKNVVLSLTTTGDVLATCNFCTQQVRRLIYGYLRAFTDLYISLAVLCFQTWTSVERTWTGPKALVSTYISPIWRT